MDKKTKIEQAAKLLIQAAELLTEAGVPAPRLPKVKAEGPNERKRRQLLEVLRALPQPVTAQPVKAAYLRLYGDDMGGGFATRMLRLMSAGYVERINHLEYRLTAKGMKP